MISQGGSLRESCQYSEEKVGKKIMISFQGEKEVTQCDYQQKNWVMGQFDTADNLTLRTIWHRPCKEDNLTPRTIWHHHKFYISTIVWPRNMIRNILIATIYLFDWKLSCIMSLYQIRARQGPHIKTYLISWQLFGPKISLEIHCWPITTIWHLGLFDTSENLTPLGQVGSFLPPRRQRGKFDT